ncbi:MAG: redox-regulated ATPase YchF [Nanoarchaeota archaeon]|nr:redox-regulated ATPase YchF [Nanoarchaeota archaeon]
MLIGLVGRPNSGKSTFFKAATLSEVLIANYPFATIKPNSGMAYVKIKDLASEFGKKSDPREGFVKGNWRFVSFELIDVAGLVEGASQGKGLGNEFLSDLSNADALIHVVDMSGESDGEGKPCENYYPGKDIKIIEKELDLWYFGIFKKVWRVFAKKVEAEKRNFGEAIAIQFSGLKVSLENVKKVILNTNLDFEHPSKWSEEQMLKFARELRKVSKPMIIAANKIDRPEGKENFEKIKKEFDYPIIPCFAEGELALKEADKHELIEYTPGEKSFEVKKELNEKQKNALEKVKKTLSEFGSTGVQEILNGVVLELLSYICIYPASSRLTDNQGRVLPDCFLMPPGTTALNFAFKLHSDIGNGFVKAIDLKTKRAVGKDHILKNGDGLEIMVR